MKAEQRKVLETNALADRMGTFMRRMKTQPGRSTLYWIVGGVAALLVVFLVFRWFQQSAADESQRWFFVDVGTRPHLSEVAKKDADTNAGKTARFQVAWLQYWFGLKRLGMPGDNAQALQYLDGARDEYRKLAEDCAGDPVWEPEALYGMAVITETRAVLNIDALEEANKIYADLAKKHPESARGKLAKDWIDNFTSSDKRKELTAFYQEMNTALRIPDLEMQRRLLEMQRKLGLQKKDAPPAK